MKELWPLEENKYKWVNIALRDAAGVSPTLGLLDSECPGSMHAEVEVGSKVK